MSDSDNRATNGDRIKFASAEINICLNFQALLFIQNSY